MLTEWSKKKIYTFATFFVVLFWMTGCPQISKKLWGMTLFVMTRKVNGDLSAAGYQ